MATPAPKLLTRLERAHSKQCWDNLTALIEKEFKGLEGWMTKEAHPKVTDLNKLLAGDLKDKEVRWECESQLGIIATQNKTGLKKIAYIEELLGKLQSQVLGAPIEESDQDEDTSEARLFKTRDMDAVFEEAKAVFTRWHTYGKRLKEDFKRIMSDETAIKDENAEETREERGVRRQKDSDKVSTNDAKSLKPDMLETTMPQLQIKNWYHTRGNYMVASGLSHRENHRTQLAYLRTCISEEIGTAIDFNNLRTVNNALFLIKDYMKSSVMPLTLQRIELLRYSPPQGQSQSATTQTIIQMFRECNGFEITPAEVLIICLLNTIQDKSVLIKVQKQIKETSTWEEVRNLIVKIDNASCLSDTYKQKNRFTGATVGSKACRACGKKGHMSAACTVPKEKLFCKFCDTKNSHNTSACIKKQRAEKGKKQGEQ